MTRYFYFPLSRRLARVSQAASTKNQTHISSGCQPLWLHHRTFGSRGSHHESPINLILQERAAAAKAMPISIPKTLSKDVQQGPPRVATLYEALVRPAVTRKPASFQPDDVALRADGTRLSTAENDILVDQLMACVRDAKGASAIEILDDILTRGLVPTRRAIIMAIDAAVAGGQLDLGEHALTYLQASSSSAPGSNDNDYVAGRSARTVLAVAYSTRGAHEKAARIIGIADWTELANASEQAITERMRQLAFGRDTVAWGLVVKTLTKLGAPHAAVCVVDTAMQAGVGMTDALLHLTIDALRHTGKWREAVWVFERAIEKGIVPHERTLASVLLAYSSRHARIHADIDAVERIVDMAQTPSPKFMSVALVALSSVGNLSGTETLFETITNSSPNGEADEFSFSCMMVAYYNYLERFGRQDEDSRDQMNQEVSGKIDALWMRYLKAYRLKRPSGMRRNERDDMLTKYLRVKTRCFRNSDAVAVLEDISNRNSFYPWISIRIAHITAVLGAIELSCDIVLLERLLAVMEKCNLSHDMRSLGFAVGTYVCDGNLKAALELVREKGSQALCRVTPSQGYRDYYPVLLLRRLQLLASGFKDIGVGPIADLDITIADLENQRTTLNLTSRRQRGTRYGPSDIKS